MPMTTQSPAAEKQGEEPRPHNAIPREQLADFCRRNHIR